VLGACVEDKIFSKLQCKLIIAVNGNDISRAQIRGGLGASVMKQNAAGLRGS
jgi:uncharacterized protein (UPF0371 family)